MANTIVSSAPVRPGRTGSSASQRSPFAKRRRILIAISLLLVLGVAALANYGPLHAYRDARARLQDTVAKVTALEAEKAELQAQLGKLSEAGYMETLARQELAYARPGEDLYIVTGGSAAAGSEAATPGPAETISSGSVDRPGLFERILSALGGLF